MSRGASGIIKSMKHLLEKVEMLNFVRKQKNLIMII